MQLPSDEDMQILLALACNVTSNVSPEAISLNRVSIIFSWLAYMTLSSNGTDVSIAA